MYNLYENDKMTDTEYNDEYYNQPDYNNNHQLTRNKPKIFHSWKPFCEQIGFFDLI